MNNFYNELKSNLELNLTLEQAYFFILTGGSMGNYGSIYVSQVLIDYQSFNHTYYLGEKTYQKLIKAYAGTDIDTFGESPYFYEVTQSKHRNKRWKPKNIFLPYLSSMATRQKPMQYLNTHMASQLLFAGFLPAKSRYVDKKGKNKTVCYFTLPEPEKAGMGAEFVGVTSSNTFSRIYKEITEKWEKQGNWIWESPDMHPVTRSYLKELHLSEYDKITKEKGYGYDLFL